MKTTKILKHWYDMDDSSDDEDDNHILNNEQQEIMDLADDSEDEDENDDVEREVTIEEAIGKPENSGYTIGNPLPAKRLAIAYLYEVVFHSPPKNGDKWKNGREGVVYKICDKLESHSASTRKTVRNVLDLVLDCKAKQIQYHGQVNNENENRGIKPIIDIVLHKAQLIAKSIKTGNSRRYNGDREQIPITVGRSHRQCCDQIGCQIMYSTNEATNC